MLAGIAGMDRYDPFVVVTVGTSTSSLVADGEDWQAVNVNRPARRRTRIGVLR